MAHANGSRSATDSADASNFPVGARVRRKHQPDEHGQVVALPSPPLARVDWGDYTCLNWLDDLELAPRKISLRDQLRRRMRQNSPSPKRG